MDGRYLPTGHQAAKPLVEKGSSEVSRKDLSWNQDREPNCMDESDRDAFAKFVATIESDAD